MIAHEITNETIERPKCPRDLCGGYLIRTPYLLRDESYACSRLCGYTGDGSLPRLAESRRDIPGGAHKEADRFFEGQIFRHTSEWTVGAAAGIEKLPFEFNATQAFHKKPGELWLVRQVWWPDERKPKIAGATLKQRRRARRHVNVAVGQAICVLLEAEPCHVKCETKPVRTYIKAARDAAGGRTP